MARRYAIRSLPSWIRSALNTTETDVPAVLATVTDDGGQYVPIAPTFDAFQGGLGLGQPTTVALPLPDPTGGVFRTLGMAADPGYGYMIFGLDFTAGALAVTRNPVLAMLPSTPFANTSWVQLSKVALATLTRASWKDVAGTADARLFIPPGFTPIAYGNDMDPAETITVTASLVRVPAGFKPY